MIDANNKEWKAVFTQVQNKRSDTDGFKQIYVPKDQILSENQVFSNKSNKKDGSGKSYIYREKKASEKKDLLIAPETEEKPAEKKQAGQNTM